jgi:pimeloyl-ACP methyl ester carboxylesterase
VFATASAATYVEAKNQTLSAANGVDYAYRATSASDTPPLVLLQHFRGNLDNWDPALIDALASGRRVITFDNRGVAASSGTTPSTIAQMALDAIDFIDALEVGEVDLLGFSIGSFVAQEIALVRPSIVRNAVLASSAPQGASGMPGWAPEVIGAVGKPETSPAEYLSVFFASSETSRAAGQQVAGRVFGAARPTATRRPAGRPGCRSTTPYVPGDSRTTPYSSASRRSTRPCSWPTATATP